MEIAASAIGEEPSPKVRDALLAACAPSDRTIASTRGNRVESAVPGLRMKILAMSRARDWGHDAAVGQAEDTRSAAHHHSGPEECFVISGSVNVEGRLLRAGDFHHAEGDSDHAELWTDEGVEVLLVASASDYAS